MYTHIHTYTHSHTCTHIHAYTCICIYTQRHTCMYTYSIFTTHVHTHMCTYILTYTHIHTHKYTHAHIHTNTYTWIWPRNKQNFTLSCCQQNAAQVIRPPEPCFYISFISCFFLYFFSCFLNYCQLTYHPLALIKLSVLQFVSRAGFLSHSKPSPNSGVQAVEVIREICQIPLPRALLSSSLCDFCDSSIRVQPQGDSLFSEIRETAAVHTGCPLSRSLPILLLIEM